MGLRTIIQIITFVFVLYCIFGLIKWSARAELRRLWAIPALVWMIHTAIFYLCTLPYIILEIPHAINFTDWSAFLRLHGYITTSFLVFTLLKLNGKLDGHNDVPRLRK